MTTCWSYLNGIGTKPTNASFIRSLESLNITQFSLAGQPIPASLQEVSADKRPDPLAMNPANGDRVWIEYSLGWLNTMCETVCQTDVMESVNGAKQYQQWHYAGVKPTHYQSGNVSFTSYNSLFLNDARLTQGVPASYGTANYT